jgi:ribonuclease HI
MNKTKIIIYTDGAYSRLRNVGAYAFIVQYLVYNSEHEEYELKKENSFSKEVVSTTNNRMELQAVIDALNYLKRPCDNVEIISDATYVVDTVNRWINSFVKDPKRLNHDLMLELHKAIRRHKSVTAKWVKGHSKDIRNQRVNELAQKAAGTWKGK